MQYRRCTMLLVFSLVLLSAQSNRLIGILKTIPYATQDVSRNIKGAGKWIRSRLSSLNHRSRPNEESKINDLEAIVEDLKIANAILSNQVVTLRKTTVYYKKRAEESQKSAQTIRRLLESQIKDLEDMHEQEKLNIIEDMTQAHEQDIDSIRAELQETFEQEKAEICARMDSIRLEEVGLIRMELYSEIEAVRDEKADLEEKLAVEKRKTKARISEMEKLVGRQQDMSQEMETLKRSLKTVASTAAFEEPVAPPSPSQVQVRESAPVTEVQTEAAGPQKTRATARSAGPVAGARSKRSSRGRAEGRASGPASSSVRTDGVSVAEAKEAKEEVEVEVSSSTRASGARSSRRRVSTRTQSQAQVQAQSQRNSKSGAHFSKPASR